LRILINNLFKKIVCKSTSNIFIQLFRYTLVGGLAFLVDFSLLYILTDYLHIHYMISAAISFICGLIVNYLVSLYWVFSTRVVKKVQIEFIIYSAIGIGGLFLNELILWLCTDVIQIYYLFSKIISAAFVYLFNFFMRRQMLFNEKNKTEVTEEVI